jgi:hypothetical protein
VNGYRLTFSNDEAYERVMAVAAGELDEVVAIADRFVLVSPGAGSPSTNVLTVDRRRFTVEPARRTTQSRGGPCR